MVKPRDVWLRRICAGACLLILAGFGGGLHPIGDSLAVFGGVFAMIALAIMAISQMPGRMRLLVAVIATLALAPRVIGWAKPISTKPPMATPVLTLYQKNLHFPRADRRDVVKDIRAFAPDVVTLQEVSQPNLVVLDALRGQYPHQAFCPFETYGGIAILSREEAMADQAICLPGQGLSAVQLMTPAGPVWVAVVHLHWPWPFEQPREFDPLLAELEKLDGPVILAGDFNMVRWSHLIRRSLKTFDAKRPGPLRSTFHLPVLGLGVTIDHMFIPESFDASVKTRPKFASDHHGLAAEIWVPQP